MIKLKNILAEGFAWERKEGKGLPTLAEVQAEYNAKQLKENTGDIFDEIADELGISPESFDNALNSTKAELDIIEKIYMSDSYTRTEALNIIADMLDIDINESTDDVYLAANESRDENRSSNESGLMVIGRTQLDNNKIGDIIDGLGLHAEWDVRHGHWLFPEDEESYDELEELLANEFAQHGIHARFEGIFNESLDAVGEEGRTETISAKRATAELKQKLAGKRSDGMGAYTSTIYGVDDSGKKVKLTSLADIAKFKTFGITEKEPRWQDNDGDGKWYEPGDDVKENVNESFIGRLKKNLIGGAVRK